MADPSRSWNKWRLHFRLCRIAVLLVILALVCAVFWLNRIGLPDFAKERLVSALRQRGIELQFVRLRLNFVRGLVADNVRIGGATPDSPSLSLQEVRLQLNYHALFHRKLQLDGLVLRQGKFILPWSTNQPSSALAIDHIQAELRFQTNDVCSLDNFQASFAGATFVLSGQVSHPEAVTNWPAFHRKPTVSPGISPAGFRKIAGLIHRFHFDPASRLSLNINGDARDPNSFSLHLAASAPVAQTPWGSARNLAVIAYSTAPIQKTNSLPSPPMTIEWKARVSRLNSEKFQAGFISCNGSWSATNGFQWTARLSQARSGQFFAQSINCDGFWQPPQWLQWKVRLSELKSEKLDVDYIACDGFWHPPNLVLTNLYARLGGGQLQAQAQFNTDTREFSFTNSSCFDVNALAGLFTDKTHARLAQFSIPQPPEFHGSGSMVLPESFQNPPPHWQSAMQPTIHLEGQFAVTNLAISGISLPTAHAHFIYSNEIWTLPAVIIRRPEGELRISGEENDRTLEYQWHIRGMLDPNCARPILTGPALTGFNLFTFARPLQLNTRIRGRLYDYDSITASGHATLQKFTIRGEPVDNVDTEFAYAHLIASFYHPHLEAGVQTMHADGICLDYPADRIYFTNGLGTADPQMVVNAIGPIQAQLLRPYHFLALPTAEVNGYAPLRNPTNADLDFKVVGTTPLGWYKLKTPAISGEIHWVGPTLILTNIAAAVYNGTGTANAFFYFKPQNTADFSFTVNLQNIDVHALAGDLSTPTNHLEGRASGHFVVTSGDSESWRTCNGYGQVRLQDGLLWDVPVFGILSPVLNVVSPGLGNSRATDASAQFVMTHGVISTDKLEIHTMMMRLDYSGTVDLMGNLNAHVTAELFRDLPGVGQLLSTVSWPATKIFESKVTGTVQNPHSKPIYVPRIFLYMLHPIHTLEDWLPNDSNMSK